jgi:16S rRNA (uracil1498-N3)-methyltransferase
LGTGFFFSISLALIENGMAQHFFYYPETIDRLLQTSEEESKHIARVLRLQPGDHANFTDGRGTLVLARLIDAHPKRCMFEVLETSLIPKVKPYLHIAVAPTKNISRIEWFIEKATEMGIDEISPVLCDHSERTKINRERLEKIAIAALKQSQQVHLPRVNELIKLDKLVSAVHENQTQKLMAYLSDEATPLLKNIYQPGDNALILIGPEGDFSSNEISDAISKGFQPISLGENRLRTETAALAACHTFVLMNQ